MQFSLKDAVHSAPMPDIAKKEEKGQASYLRRAMLMALLSKTAGVLPQLIVLPTAFRAMGPELFGVYGLFLGLVSGAMLLDIGIGPALTRILSVEFANPKRSNVMLITGLVASIVIACLCCGAAGIFVATGKATELITDLPLDSRAAAQAAAWIAVTLLAVQPLSSYASRVAAATGALDVFNCYGAFGNVLASAAAAAALAFTPSPAALLVALNGTQILCRIAGGMHVLARCYVPSCAPQLSLALLASLFRDSLWYLPLASSGLALRELARVAIASYAGATALGYYSILVQFGAVALSLLTSFTMAQWPLLAREFESGDDISSSKSIGRLIRIGASVSCLTIVLVVIEGVFGWVRIVLVMETGDSVIYLYAAYLVMTFWSHVCHVIYMARGVIKTASAIVIMQVIVVAGLGLFGFRENLTAIVGLLLAVEAVAVVAYVWDRVGASKPQRRIKPNL